MITKKRILSALLGGRVDRIPAWSPVVSVTVAMMEHAKAPWPQSHSDPEMMARLAAMPWELTRLPSATVPFCLSLEAEALGCELDWGTLNRTPSVKKHAFSKPDEFDVPEDLLERGRIPVVLKAIEILKEHLGDEIPINAKVTGPFTIAGLIFGVSNFLSWIKTDPEYVHQATRKANEVTKELACAFVEHGADTINISDPTSSGDLLSGEYYREFVFPYHKEIAESVKVPLVLHICGFTEHLLPHIKETGFDAYSFEEKLDVLAAKKILGNDITLIGNVAPVGTMLQGTPEKVREDAIKCMQDGIDILSPGCTVSPLTSLENLRALVNTAENFTLIREPGKIVQKNGMSLARGFDNRGDFIDKKLNLESILPEKEPFRKIAREVADGEVESTKYYVNQALANGVDPLTIATEGLLKGMDAVSNLYNRKQVYVPEIILASKALNAGMNECGTVLESLNKKGIVLIHTADGDLHDIGKNIVGAIVEANGYRVIDLGTSVKPERIISEVKNYRPLAVIGSSLMTTTRGAFLATGELLQTQGFNIPFIIGGGACDSAFAGQRNLIYAKDPNSVVKVLDSLNI